MNSLGTTVKNLNSYISRNIASPAVETLNSAANSAATTAASVASSAGGYGIWIFIGIFLVAIVLFSFYYKQIKQAVAKMLPTKQIQEAEQALSAPIVDGPPRNSEPIDDKNKYINKILPGMNEVFNVSSNKYTYGDAEPLCRALGAELATYDQVKQSFENGADWCNYGWTKGQLALYPTQEGTWEKLQMGPESQRTVCGRPGVNGGFFDNPELRFGVNCYGKKPGQSKHDANKVASGDNMPVAPAAIDYEKKVAHYKSEADTIGILPFNSETWG